MLIFVPAVLVAAVLRFGCVTLRVAGGHGCEQEEVEQQRAAGLGGADLGSTGAAALEEEVGEGTTTRCQERERKHTHVSHPHDVCEHQQQHQNSSSRTTLLAMALAGGCDTKKSPPTLLLRCRRCGRRGP